MKKGFSVLILLLSVIALIGVGGGAYYLGSKNALTLPEITLSFPKKNAPVIPTSSAQKATKPAEPLFSGTIKKLSTDLGLFKITDIDKENGIPESIAYYSAGVYLRGNFKDYTRILAIRPAEGPGPSIQFILATKDYKEYVLDDPLNKSINYPESDWDSPYMYLNKNKISQTGTLDSDHPQVLVVDQTFSLIKMDSVLTEFKKTGQKDKNTNDIYQEMPISVFDQPLLLPSAQKALTLYTGGVDWSNAQPQGEKEKTQLATRKKYLNKTTRIHGVDSTGIAFTYILSTEKDVAAYLDAVAAQETSLISYKKQVALYNEKKLGSYPTSPEYVKFPGLRFNKSTIGLGSAYYTTYDSAFPGACGGNQETYIVDSITESDLEAVSTSSPYPLFILKDAQHPLYKLAYESKTEQGEESFKGVNDGKSIPSYADYVAKHPLLFFKEAWGKWAVVGEFDLKLMGGCGKPVVYLYPETPTDIHVSFATPVSLNTNIPTYKNGWLVNALPDGTLTDLQPEYTNCSAIDTDHAGSEYALSACKNNSYPYLYWSGKSVENAYPHVEGGWIVEKNDLKTFMQSKLNEMGLNAQESNDMITYWAPKMSEKNTPYYRISFLQTGEMNNFIPMKVSPQPDSVLRIFLDWRPLVSKPSVALAPQKLEKMQRRGFTYVEWGGLR